MDNYYKPSGKFSATSLLYFIVLSCTAFPILGLIYAYCIWYIPFFYINFLITGAFGFAIGYLINVFVIGKGKVRNTMLAVILGILGGLIAMYFHWSVWTDLVINSGESYGTSRIGITVSNIKFLQVFTLVTQPDILFSLIGEINEVGVWGIRNTTVSGVFLTIIWIIELLAVIGISTLTSFSKAGEPFCEINNNWFKENVLPTFNHIPEKSKMIADLEKGDQNAFNELTTSPNIEQDHSVFTLYTSDQNKCYLSIENKKAKRDDKGKLDFDTDTFIEYISLNTTLKDILLAK
ncbi:hypothetical protein [Aquimarina algiphila]|uniref:hypothetical protein n=1 Tax=Aquimarina algiphila TaxID=2047982 RepID=UPI00232F6F49|nr:hypothetical protein [Aquimarina algiphila]